MASIDPTGGIRTARDCYGDFIGAEDLGDAKATVRIIRMRRDEFKDQKTQDVEKKIVITFEPRPDGQPRKEWVAGPLSIATLAAMFGNQTKNWIGKRITLYATDQIMPMPTAVGKDRFCVRIYGSPDMEGDMVFKYQPPRKRVIDIRLVGGPGKSPAAPVQEPEPAPEPFFEPPQEG